MEFLSHKTSGMELNADLIAVSMLSMISFRGSWMLMTGR